MRQQRDQNNQLTAVAGLNRSAALLTGETTLEVCELALDLGDPSRHVLQRTSQRGDFATIVSCLGSRANVRALPLPRDDQPITLEIGERSLDGADRHAELRRHCAVSWQLGTNRVLAAADGRPQRVGDLLVRRTRVIRVQLVHADQDTRLGRLLHLGEHRLATLSRLTMLSNVSLVAGKPGSKQEAPASAATPAGAHIETLGASMQFEDNRMYRVKAVAEALDVSVATIYRAIESGKLDALKIGTGKGTIRITGKAANIYVNACSGAAYQAYVVEGAPIAASDDVAGEVA